MKIKFNLVYFLLLISQVSVYSQAYIPLVEEGATWIMYHSDDGTDYWALRIEEDTIINDLTYRKLYRYNLGTELTFPATYQNQKTLSGVLRDDIINKKVYGYLGNNTWNSFLSEECYVFMIYNEDVEIEIFDFNKSIGDVFDDCHLDLFEVGSEITKNEIVEMYGQERRVLSNENGLQFIEGVGYEDGLFQSAHTWVHAGWGFGMINFCNQFDGDCELITNTQEIDGNQDLLIYPNPIIDRFSISQDIDINKIDVFDLLGNKIAVREIGRNEFQFIDRNVKGIFYAKLELIDKTLLTRKLLKIK